MALTKPTPEKRTLTGVAGEYGSQGKQSLSDPKNPPVYMGRSSGGMNLPQGPYAAGYTPQGPYAPKADVDNIRTLSDVSNDYFKWDDKTKNKYLTQLGLAGIDISGKSDSQLAGGWASYVAQAAQYWAVGKRLTPWDILAKDRQGREASAAAAPQPKTVTQTSSAIDLSTAEDARAIFTQSAQSLLGRDPTKNESKAFQAKLNAYERANPTVTTQTSHYLGQELQSSSSTSKGGVRPESRGMMASDQQKADPEYGAYQASTTYMNALMGMLGG
jgi:hypothetical protein